MCAVNAVVCCVLLVHGRCVMYAGGSRSCPMRSRDAGGYAQCAALYAGGRGGVGRDALCANLYAGGCGGWALFAGDVGGAGIAGGDALCAIYMLEAVESWLCLLEVMRCVLTVCSRLWSVDCVCWGCRRC